MGIFRPGELTEEEKTRNKDALNAGGSSLDGPKGSVMSFPDEDKLKEELARIAESDAEDDEFIKEIEEA